MKSSEIKSSIPTIAPTATTARDDGRETRQRIIDCAGRLFAQNGYDKTTSKSICLEAGVNLAAINYHFGSRDGLYQAVIAEVHQHIITITDLEGLLANTEMTPRTKVESFISTFIHTAVYSDTWYVPVWIREILTPSPLFDTLVDQAVLKFNLITRLFSEYLGYDLMDVRLYAAIGTIMSAFSMSCIGRNNPMLTYVPVHFDKDAFVGQLKANAMVVLTALKAEADWANSLKVAN